MRQEDQFRNPDNVIAFGNTGDGALLNTLVRTSHGQGSFDAPRFELMVWEIPRVDKYWVLRQSTTRSSQHFAGCYKVFRWEDGKGQLADLMQAKETEGYTSGKWRAGVGLWGSRGVLVNQMNNLSCSLYLGQSFDENTCVITPNDQSQLPAIWLFCTSESFEDEVRRINQKVNVNTATLAKVPFNLAYWQKVAAEKYAHGLPKPFSSDPTQWLFNGHPAGADQPLHVAVARLAGYEWPRQTGSSFPDCPALGTDGLEAMADEDGIVCLAAVRGEASAVERLRKLLAAALGGEWTAAKVRELLLATAVDNNARNAAPDLETWLPNSFFSEHCKLFHSRPFIWQIWDGNPHGFSALVNYHKLAAPNGQGRKTLDQLTFTYLGDWIDRQKDDQAKGINGADARLAAALDLQAQLKKILEGEPPYDIFVRWKPLHQQAIGWEPDINDGVRLNIRPFLSAQLRKGGKTGAGILRAKPGTIKWAKDRGKEPMRSKDDFPWFWGWDENSPALATDFGAPVPGAPPGGDSFDGNRWNDLHYTRAAKEAARSRHSGGSS